MVWYCREVSYLWKTGRHAPTKHVQYARSLYASCVLPWLQIAESNENVSKPLLYFTVQYSTYPIADSRVISLSPIVM
jgi:hypothetical protein